jgi:hypothetical protein
MEDIESYKSMLNASLAVLAKIDEMLGIEDDGDPDPDRTFEAIEALKENQPAKSELKGTFACPICGLDKPHAHSEAEQKGYREDQIRNDGWTSTAKRRPSESGWYLCMDVEVPREQYGQYDDSPNARQLSWFLWVRSATVNPIQEKSVPEVLHFDRVTQRWTLRNCLGDATPSGREMRVEVSAKPRYWRSVPPLGSAEIKTP